MDWSDEFLAYLELKKSLFFRYIPKDAVLEYISGALDLGYKGALEIENNEIRELYTAHAIQIHYIETSAKIGSGMVRAEFEYDHRGRHKVFLYAAAIQELINTTGSTEKQVEDLLLAHEWFHFLESERGFAYEQLPPLEVPGLFGRKRKVMIRQLSEIAAHAFVRGYQQLPVLPLFYDVQELVKNGQLSEEELVEEYKQFQKYK
ncbi:hypothetical protein IW492_07700 [Enterococcus sp. BWB1-3]|uniref:hypothetical protein n=1 Tax=Enterococcus sp. BWB1-3 TaxID=2787713 RepID=UPI00192346CF|nr:hypothetical protein [Enterococcus sp. BWB1-3]MBL1229117.1 hypothetical protein [Enterococcus sp. BWB1-3]